MFELKDQEPEAGALIYITTSSSIRTTVSSVWGTSAPRKLPQQWQRADDPPH
jgi:hypothetical protein